MFLIFKSERIVNIKSIMVSGAVILFFVLNTEAAVSDQKNSSLPSLFSELRLASSITVAAEVEKKIWLIWTTHKDPKINTLMVEGIKLLEKRNAGAAILVFNHIIVKAPEFSEAWNKRATGYFLKGNYRKSINDIHKTLALEPRHFGAIAGLGLIFNALEVPENALEAFKRVQEIYPLSLSAAWHIERLKVRVPSLHL